MLSCCRDLVSICHLKDTFKVRHCLKVSFCVCVDVHTPLRAEQQGGKHCQSESPFTLCLYPCEKQLELEVMFADPQTGAGVKMKSNWNELGLMDGAGVTL